MIRITRTTRNLEKLIAKLEDLNKQSVETGVFLSQGEHPDAGMSFVDLARMHEEGDGNFPPRTVRPMVMNTIKSEPFLQKTANYLNRYLYHNNSLNYTLSYIGQDMVTIGKSFFGVINNPYMKQNAPYTISKKEKDTPLVDEGYLRDAWAYKTSINSMVVEN